MQACAHCAQNALVGIEAANACTNCGAVTVAQAGVSPVMIAGLFVAGTAILAVQLFKGVRGLRVRRLAVA